ncbi:MAG: TetR/AcrR family transcriptional regulator [Clostridia bacterium]|jgi:AcrR family transcriptional regulator|nr:TetR/AcrR family transcriptional regulator [Clostridia bacterium]
MQVKKEDLRENILQIAENEFLKRGFKGASMRTIAKKANTTLGNIYNYFSSKEELLEAVVGEVPLQIEKLLGNHTNYEADMTTSADINQAIDETDPKDLGIDLFLNKKFVILMEGCSETKYEKYREKLLVLGKNHVLHHVRHNQKYEKFAEIMAMTFFNGMIFIAKTSETIEEARSNFIKLYKLVCTGLVDQYEREGKHND